MKFKIKKGHEELLIGQYKPVVEVNKNKEIILDPNLHFMGRSKSGFPRFKPTTSEMKGILQSIFLENMEYYGFVSFPGEEKSHD